MAHSLRVLVGPAAGTELQFEEEFVVGRMQSGPGNLGGDHELSRVHARIRRKSDETLVIEDIGSTNGTFVNGWRVSAPTSLSAGDRIQVGQTLLELASVT